MNETVTVEMNHVTSELAGPCDCFCEAFGTYIVRHAALPFSWSRACEKHLAISVGIMMQDGERARNKAS